MANLGHFPMGEDPERFKSYVGPVLAEIAAEVPLLEIREL
jgi:hypothetical protein